MTKTFTLITFILLLFSCTSKKSNILNENFNSNTKGWAEEKTEPHYLEIKDGYYFIQSLDSTANRTSSINLDRSFLYSLPNNYSIQTSIEILESEMDTASCGLILEGNSLEYEFRFFETGKIIVEEYNFASKKFATYDFENIKLDTDLKEFNVEIKIDGWHFELYINNERLGRGKMLAKSWSRLVPFAGRLSSIKVDYLVIK
jgi:hypothetical protein